MNSSIGVRFLLFMARHRMAVLLAAGALAAGALFQSRRVVLNDDYLVMLPSADPIVADFVAYNTAFKQLDRMVFDVSMRTEDRGALVDAADALYEGLIDSGQFDRITYRLAQASQTEIVDLLLAAMPALMDEEDLREMERLLNPENIGEYLSRMRKELAGPNGVFLKHVVPYDPIGVSGLLMGRLEVLRAGTGGANIVDDRIASADGRHLMLIAEPSFPSSDYRRSRELLAEVDALVERIAAAHPENTPRILTIGGHRATLDNVTIVKRDIGRTLSVAIVTMIALSLVAYRRRWLAFATILPAAFGALMAGFAISLMHESIYSISLGFGVVLLGITVDYAIHVIYHIENHARASRRETAELISQIAAPIAMGAATTIGAFALMTLSPVAGHRQVGLFAAVGLASAAAFSIVVLPLLIPRARSVGDAPLSLPLSRAFRGLMQWRDRHVVGILSGAAVFTLICIFGVSRLRFEGDLARVNGVTADTRQAEEAFRETWGDVLNLATIMVTGRNEEEALAKNDELARMLARLEREGEISSVSSISSIVASRETQRLNMERWREFWTPERTEEVRAAVAARSRPLGYSASAFAPFFDLIETGGTTLSIAGLNKGPLAPALEQRIARSGGDVSVSTLLKLDRPGTSDRLRERLAERLPGAALVEVRALTDRISELARSGLGLFAMLATGVVSIVLLVAFGSVELAAMTLVPIAISIVWTFGVMGFVGLPVDLFNSVFIIFIIGVGIDYSIFLVTARLARLRGQIDRLDASGGSITICALTTISACGVLMIARHPALFSIGATSMLGMSFSFISTLVFVPLGASILLSRASSSGAPRLWHLLGGMWIFVYAACAQILLFRIVHPTLRWRYRREPERVLPRLRELGRAGLRNMFLKFPYGSTSYGAITEETFRKPAIVISNHESSVDIPLIASLPGDIRLTLKQRIADAPWLGIAARKLGHIAIRPGEPDSTLQACRDALAQGACVHFFPEATRSTDGFGRRFHKGAFELAIELGADILPIVICDTGVTVPRDGYWVEKHKIRVNALERITPSNFDYSRGARELARHAQRIVSQGRQVQLDLNNTPDHVRRKVARRYRYLSPWIEPRVARSLRTDPAFAELDAVAPREGSVLEIGCGFGLRGHWLTEFCDTRRYVGVDEDENAIRIACNSLLGKRHAAFERHDILAWNWPEADVIILTRGLAETDSAGRRRILAKARQALNEGGFVLIRLQTARSNNKDRLDAQALVSLCGDAGFVDVETVGADSRREAVFVRACSPTSSVQEARTS